jgi:hypothetical protein
MTRPKKRIYILLISYLLIIGFGSVYHALNFSDYWHTKGSETINYIVIMFCGSVLFEVIAANLTQSIDWRAVVFGTAVNAILSLILGIIIIMVSQIKGTPGQMILIFGSINLTILSLVTVGHVRRLNE